MNNGKYKSRAKTYAIFVRYPDGQLRGLSRSPDALNDSVGDYVHAVIDIFGVPLAILDEWVGIFEDYNFIRKHFRDIKAYFTSVRCKTYLVRVSSIKLRKGDVNVKIFWKHRAKLLEGDLGHFERDVWVGMHVRFEEISSEDIDLLEPRLTS